MVLGNQHKILLGLVLFLSVLLTYRVFNPYRQETVSRLTYGRTTKITPNLQGTAQGAKTPRPTQVMTSLWINPPRVVVNMHRDPFRKAAQTAPAQATQPVNPKPQPPPKQPSALERAKEQLGRFKVFGSFHQGERASLFLQRGKQVLVISTGDRLDGKFKIESIHDHTAVVSTPDIEAPFEFSFEELDISTDGFRSSPLASPPRRTAGPRPSFEAQPFRPVETPPTELSGSTTPEPEDDLSAPPVSLPKPPPTDSPAPPPSSKGSPSKSYLPGNKPQEVD